jgi:hypothetical protein
MNALEPLGSVVAWVSQVQGGVTDLNDRAAYTYQEGLGQDPAKDAAVRQEVAEKYKADSRLQAAGHVGAFLVPLLAFLVKDRALAQLQPLLEPIDQVIPGPVKEYLSAQAILERSLDKFVQRVAATAAKKAVAKAAAKK